MAAVATYLALSLAGPALGLALCAGVRAATEASDGRRLASMLAGADESAWLGRVAAQAPSGRVSPALAASLYEAGAVGADVLAACEGASGVYAMRPSACCARYALLAAFAAATLACGLASGSAAACSCCALFCAMSAPDLWWRRALATPCAAVVALSCVEAGSASPALAALACGCACAAVRAAFRAAAGAHAFGGGDCWLAAAMAAALLPAGAGAAFLACVSLSCELAGCLLLTHDETPRPAVPLAPFLVVPVALACGTGWAA